MEIFSGLDVWIKKIICSNENKNIQDILVNEYIVSTIFSFKTKKLIDNSFVLEFAKAKYSSDFEGFQNIGDNILCRKILCKDEESFNDLNICLARKSYYMCYLLLNKTWPIYEQLADELPFILKRIEQNLNKDINKNYELYVNKLDL
jgi:hypothetical protein